MPISPSTSRRIVLLGLLLAGLVVLADGVARFELAQAVDASTTGVHLVAVAGG